MDSAPKAWGRRLEDIVAQAYQEETGNPVYHPTQPIEWNKEFPFLLCSLDRLTEVDGRGRLLECKTARTGEGWGMPGTDEVPPGYLLQVQHQLAVTRMDHADLAVLIGGQELRTYTVARDDVLISRLTNVLTDFWKRVEMRTPPPPDWEHPLTPELIRRSQRLAEGKVIEVDGNAGAHIAHLTELKAKIRALEETKDLIEAKVLAAVGDAAEAHAPTGHIVRRTLVRRKEYTVKADTYYRMTIKEPK